MSGVPGAGKTETVREVIRTMKVDALIKSAKFAEINALKLTSPKQAFVELHSVIFAQMRISANRAQEQLELHFQTLEKSTVPSPIM